MQFVTRIELDGAAFQAGNAEEIGRLLREVADLVEKHEHSGDGYVPNGKLTTLVDMSGQQCGYAGVYSDGNAGEPWFLNLGQEHRIEVWDGDGANPLLVANLHIKTDRTENYIQIAAERIENDPAVSLFVP